MELKKVMIDEMVNELNCWDRPDLISKATVIYRQELESMTVEELLYKYNNLTFHCLEDGSPRP